MGAEQHRATARALDILERIAASKNEGCTLSELAADLQAPKSSLFPILHTLADRKYIRLDEQKGRYMIGITAYTLGASFLEGRGELNLITDIMGQVTASCGETCQLAVRDRGSALYIGKVDSPEVVRLVSHVGARIPANCTALGKALLSDLTDEETASLFPDGLPCMTPHSITDFPTLYKQLRQVRETGFAQETEEANEHLKCIAVPLKKNGHVFAAVSVSVPLFRCTKEKEEQVRACLCKARAQIENLAADPSFRLDQ